MLRGCIALLVMVWQGVAGNVSYVVLQYRSESLIRVSDDGRSQITIATGVGGRGARGYGLAVDAHGDYIVAAVSSLLRVTPSGVVSKIAQAPRGSQWLCVAVDGKGNYVVADNQRHAIWRVSGNEESVEMVANYPVQKMFEMEDVGVIVDASGDYLLMEGNSFAAHFWRVSPAGAVRSIPLRGDRMLSGSSIVPDIDGTYLVASFRDQAIFRVTPSGEVTKFATVGGLALTGLARNRETGELVATFNREPVLRKISANGLSVTTFGGLGYSNAIIAEAGR